MNLEKKIFEIGHNAKEASIILNLLDRDRKNKILEKAALNIKNCEKKILEANKKDLIKAKEKNLNSALVDRLVLNKDRIQAITNKNNLVIPKGLTPQCAAAEAQLWLSSAVGAIHH